MTTDSVSNIAADPHAPYLVYKSDISYFSGKLEAYLRYKQIPYKGIDMDIANMEVVAKNTGVKKIPAVKTSDNLWLYDTTPMLQWFEKQYPQTSIFPEDPALRFLALLIEDYGDEWLWRPSMWWRWMPKISRNTLGWKISTEFFPPPLRRTIGWYFGRRQLNEWLWADGVNEDNVDDVRDMFYRELEFLEPLFEQQPFILGSHPSAADFGYFGSMFRHFGNDPISAEEMRRHGPNTYEWLARLWNTKPSKLPATPAWFWPEGAHWGPLLNRIVNDYLPYLHQNAMAFKQKQKSFEFRGATLQFHGTKTTNYRVWCREVLQLEYNALGDSDRLRLNDLFSPHGDLAIIEKDGIVSSDMSDQFRLPRDPNFDRVNRGFSFRTRLLGQPRN